MMLLTCTLLLLITAAHSYRLSPILVRKFALHERTMADIDHSMDSQTTLTTTDIVANFFQPLTTIQSDNESIIPKLKVFGSDALQKMRLPRGKDEAWRFTNLAKVFTNKYYLPVNKRKSVDSALLQPYIDIANSKSTLVFVDGVLHPSYNSLSAIDPQHASFGSILTSTSKVLPSFIEEEMKVIYDQDIPARKSFGSDVLTGLNLASMDDAHYLHIQSEAKIKQPIHIIYCSSSSESADCLHSSFPRLIVKVEDGAHVNIKQIYITLPQTDSAETLKEGGKEASNFFGSNTRFVVGKDAFVEHTLSQELSVATRVAEVISSRVAERGSYNLCLFQTGAQSHRLNLHIDLAESFANCTINGVMLSRDDRMLDLHSSVEHLAPDTTSVQNQKILLGDYGKGVFKGYIHIPTIAQRSDAAQLARTIMLGQKSRVQAMPTLEIQADDIKCNHGAAIADLDENAMFYFASRGVERFEARKALTKSFALADMRNSLMSKDDIVRFLDQLSRLTVREAVSTDGTKGLRNRTAQQINTM